MVNTYNHSPTQGHKTAVSGFKSGEIFFPINTGVQWWLYPLQPCKCRVESAISMGIILYSAFVSVLSWFWYALLVLLSRCVMCYDVCLCIIILGGEIWFVFSTQVFQFFPKSPNLSEKCEKWHLSFRHNLNTETEVKFVATVVQENQDPDLLI